MLAAPQEDHMFGLPALDLILGLTFVYLLLSLLCTAINELIAQWFNMRPKTLREGIATLLSGGFNAADVATSLSGAESSQAAVAKRAPAELERYQSARDELREKAAAVDTAAHIVTRLRLDLARAEAQVTISAMNAAGIGAGAASAVAQSSPALAAMRTAVASAETTVFGARQAHDKASNEFGAARRTLIEAAGGIDVVQAFEKESFGRKDVVNRFFGHPLVDALSLPRKVPWGRGSTRSPSYIPSRVFANALLEIVSPPDEGSAPRGIEQLRVAVAGLPPTLGRPLSIFVDEAAGDVEKVRISVEKWYEDSMERVTGLYKRRVQALTFLVACLIALFANADTISMARALARDATLRGAVANYAEAMADNGVLNPAANDTTASARIKDLTQTIDTLKSIGLPLGWQRPVFAKADIGFLWLGSKLVGLLMTAFAISLGAPFWFDMLNRVVNIRSAGRAPEEKPKPPEAFPPPRGA
jgi:hypothetical protein